jgi:putative IMPACT (imprinted ancient) family translation regulator
VTTQHALTTQHLVVDASSAKATTYFTGVHLGRGKWEGQLVTAYGKYVDELVCVPAAEIENAEIETGASGVWKISKRTVTFFGRVGEEGVMEGEG